MEPGFVLSVAATAVTAVTEGHQECSPAESVYVPVKPD